MAVVDDGKGMADATDADASGGRLRVFEACDICGSEIHSTDEHVADELSEREAEALRALAPDDEEPQPPEEDPGEPHTDGEANEWAIGAAERSPHEAKKPRKKFPNFEEKPEILIGPNLAENIDEASKALLKDPDIFQRDGALVHVARVTKEEADDSPVVKESTEWSPARHELVEGAPRIYQMATATLMERLTRLAVFTRLHRRSIIQTLPTQPLVSGLFFRRYWPKVPRLTGIAEAPFLRPDLTLCQKPGYDPLTGYLYAPNCAFPEVPSKPSRKQAVAAMRELEEVYVDFPWTPKSHRSVPIAALLTLLARPAIIGSTPAFLFTANTPGTGKSLTTDTIALLASGRCMPRKIYPRSEEEQEKVLGSYALRGAAFFSLDNIAAPFGGAPIDAVLTATDTVDLRVLGQSEIPTLRWRAVMFGTGNNIEPAGDVAERVLMARLESDMENPRKRAGFRHDDLPAWIKANRGRLVAAALTVIQAYAVAGCPDIPDCRWGSFQPWAKLIASAVTWADGGNPLSAQIQEISSVNEEIRSLATLLRGLPMLERCFKRAKRGVTAREAVHLLYEQYPTDGRLDDLRGALEQLCNPTQRRGEGKPTHQALGYKLRSFKGRVVGGKSLQSTPDRDSIHYWWVHDHQVDKESQVVDLIRK